MALATPNCHIPSKMLEDFWNGPGGERWAETQPMMDAILAPFGDAILGQLELGPQSVVCDVGCGCGATALAIAAHAPDAHVTGVDISRPMIEVARRRADEGGHRVRFVEADAGTAGIGDSNVDWIVSRFGLMFFADPGEAFENLCGWLRPGGVMVATVWNALEQNPWARGIGSLIARYIEVPAPEPRGPGPFSLADAEALDRHLGRAGFAEVEQLPLSIAMRVEGTIEDGVRFYEERGFVIDALDAIQDPSAREALLKDLHDFVAEHHDGRALAVASSARLVRATR